jgi:cyclase
MTSTPHDHDLGAGTATEVSDGVFAYIQPDGSWWINNTGFLVGRHGVVSVDACSTRRRTEAYLETIASVTAQPVRTLVNTHHHGDHTFGNYLFSGATIVGHENVRAALLDYGKPIDLPIWNEVAWGDVRLEPPFLTYTDGVTLHVDDLVAEVRYVGSPAHTNNDSVVWLPERRLLFCGDLLFNGGTPFLLMGSIDGAIDVLSGLLETYPATTIVPGHGAVCGPELVDDVLGYLRFVQRLARDGHAAGLTPLEVARETDLGEYAELLDAERIVGNLHRAFAELSGAERGAPIDSRTALMDMVAYNGGRPLSCYA